MCIIYYAKNTLLKIKLRHAELNAVCYKFPVQHHQNIFIFDWKKKWLPSIHLNVFFPFLSKEGTRTVRGNMWATAALSLSFSLCCWWINIDTVKCCIIIPLMCIECEYIEKKKKKKKKEKREWRIKHDMIHQQQPYISLRPQLAWSPHWEKKIRV